MPNHNTLVIIGASGHGKVVASIATLCGYTHILFLDDNPQIKTCLHFPVVGPVNLFTQYQTQADFIVAIGNPQIRQQLQSTLQQHAVHLATLIHPQAVISTHVQIGAGTVVMAGAVINPDTTIGQGCIINTCASVDHDCTLGDYVHVAVGVHVAGTVSIGQRTWLGMGANIINNLAVCADCLIAAGSTVVKNISQPGTYLGTPAKKKEVCRL